MSDEIILVYELFKDCSPSSDISVIRNDSNTIYERKGFVKLYVRENDKNTVVFHYSIP